MIYIKLCYLLMYIYIIGKGFNYLLTIFQQEHYDVKKLTKTLFTFYLKKKYNYIFYLMTFIIIIDNLYLYIIGIFISLLSFFFNDHFIIKLKLTKRIIRMITTLIILLLPLIFINNKWHFEYISIIGLISPFWLILINYINLPFEKLIQKRFINQARKTLNNTSSLIKIGITGSYGKTTTKNIVYNLLRSYYMTLSTPKSYNTMMGVTKTINNSLRKDHEIMIVEMGAYRKGEIREIASLIKPQIVVITDVGYQHMDTFKTIENVLSAKCEIVEKLTYDSFVIINGDNDYLRSKKFVNVKNIYYIGLKEHNDIKATNIRITNGLMKFDIVTKNETIENIETTLLGKHNITNILLSYGVVLALKYYGYFLDIPNFNNEIINQISKVEPVSNRLYYKKVDNLHIYDDSYNANEIGFQNAIEVLQLTNHYKIIITPGIVDAGDKTKEINERIASLINDVFDEIYLINNYSAQIIYDFIAKKRQENDNKKVMIKLSFEEAYNEVVNRTYLNNEKTEIDLLIENDLPDNYLMRRKA